MKRYVCLLGTVMLAVLARTAGAQTLPVRLYGDTLDEQAHALVETPEGGFCLAGWSRSYYQGPTGLSNALVVKTDAQGIPVWARTTIGANDDEAYSMVRTSDLCYVVCGMTRSYGAGAPAANIFVVKLDPNGNLLWSWVYGGWYDDMPYSIIETSDHGFALTGVTSSFGPMPMPNVFVLRLNPAGQFMWMRSYWMFPNHAEDEGWSICQTPDTGFAVCGRAKVTGQSQFDAFLMKLAPMGNVQWVRVLPGEADEDEARSVAVDAGGSIQVAGWTSSYGTHPNGPADMFVAKFTSGANPVWSRTYGWPEASEQVLDDRSLTITADGGSAVCGPTWSVGPGSPNYANFLLLKLNPGGGVQWASSHPSSYDPGQYDDVPLPMIERAAGGYAVAGYTNSWPAKLGGGDDWMLSTFDANGNRPVCAQRQTPTVDSMTWRGWYVADTMCFPIRESMPVVEVEVRCDSACYDTGNTGTREGRTGPRPHAQPVALRSAGTRLEMNLRTSMDVTVALYAADGRQVGVMLRGVVAAGRHELTLPANLAAGTYVVRASAADGCASAKVVRAR
ncbi:hypothetical protein FJY71_05320 [candidate division WOR-3 bacterium]|nr:hypothetical protein [candidate division WOR-3 bacterium]